MEISQEEMDQLVRDALEYEFQVKKAEWMLSLAEKRDAEQEYLHIHGCERKVHSRKIWKKQS